MTRAGQHLHFVGIGGAGMSAIAEILHGQGARITGSDLRDGPVLRRLAALGLQVSVGHDAAHVDGAQGLVVSTAVPADNPELAAARERGVPVLSRGAMLAELMRPMRGVAVAGTHGKTTTTALVASVLVEAGLDPTVVVGGELLGIQAAAAFDPGARVDPNAGSGVRSGARLGRGAVFVAEADESDASFLLLAPAIAVVTNIDADHMATYGHDEQRLRQAFVDFLHRLPQVGRAVVCSDDAGVRSVLAAIGRPMTTYGLGDDVDLRALAVQAVPGGRMNFTARQSGHADLPIQLNLAGEHNVRNALAALAVARELGAADAATAHALASFGGVGRRFQRHGELPSAEGGRYTLIDDYGHHPAEIAAVLAAARGAFPGRRIVAAFQPHRYTRTRDCLADFAAVLRRFDAVLLTEVYAAGEPPIAGADGRSLAHEVNGAVFVSDVHALPEAIVGLARAGDVVITLGAGSIGGVPALLLQRTGGVA